MTVNDTASVNDPALVTERWDAVIVAGGKGSRLGGASKPALVVGGLTLIDRALAAVSRADAVVVVGGPQPGGVRWTVEDPPGSGPAAGLGAGLDELSRDREPAPWTVVLAVDMPRADRAIPELLANRHGRDGAWFVDHDGYPQPLLAMYRTAALVGAIGELSHTGLADGSLRTLVAGLTMTELPDTQDVSRDLDTGEDARYWKEQLG